MGDDGRRGHWIGNVVRRGGETFVTYSFVPAWTGVKRCVRCGEPSEMVVCCR